MISDIQGLGGKQRFAYDQKMETLTRIATWIDRVATSVIGVLLRAATTMLAFVLRRGRHREWRRRVQDARRRSETSGS